MSGLRSVFKTIGIALFVLLAVFAGVWLISHGDSALTSFEDWFLRALEQRGMGYIGTWAVACVLLLIAIYINLAFQMFHALERSRANLYYWLKVLLRSLFVLAPIILIGLALDRRFGKNDFVKHPIFYEVWVRTLFVVLLLAFGILLFFFKLKWKMYYGLSEIGLALLSNLAVIRSLDVSAFPRLALSPDRILAIGVFTYLLSRGITNVAEGFQDRLAKQALAAATAAPLSASVPVPDTPSAPVEPPS